MAWSDYNPFTAISNAANSVGNAVSNTANAAATLASNAANSVGNAVVKGAETVGNIAIDGANAVVKGAETVGNMAIDSANAVVKGAETAGTMAVNGANAVGKAIKDEVNKNIEMASDGVQVVNLMMGGKESNVSTEKMSKEERAELSQKFARSSERMSAVEKAATKTIENVEKFDKVMSDVPLAGAAYYAGKEIGSGRGGEMLADGAQVANLMLGGKESNVATDKMSKEERAAYQEKLNRSSDRMEVADKAGTDAIKGLQTFDAVARNVPVVGATYQLAAETTSGIIGNTSGDATVQITGTAKFVEAAKNLDGQGMKDNVFEATLNTGAAALDFVGAGAAAKAAQAASTAAKVVQAADAAADAAKAVSTTVKAVQAVDAVADAAKTASTVTKVLNEVRKVDVKMGSGGVEVAYKVTEVTTIGGKIDRGGNLGIEAGIGTEKGGAAVSLTLTGKDAGTTAVKGTLGKASVELTKTENGVEIAGGAKSKSGHGGEVKFDTGSGEMNAKGGANNIAGGTENLRKMQASLASHQANDPKSQAAGEPQPAPAEKKAEAPMSAMEKALAQAKQGPLITSAKLQESTPEGKLTNTQLAGTNVNTTLANEKGGPSVGRTA